MEKKVLCLACDKKLRKNKWELKRHWDTNLQDRLDRGEKPAWRIPTEGITSLERFGFQRKDGPDVKKNYPPDDDKDRNQGVRPLN